MANDKLALKEMMREKHMSQVDLAEATGITPVTICRYVRGERNIRLANAVKIAKALNSTIEDTFGFERCEKKSDGEGAVIICALRYAIGRRSYMPSVVAGYVRDRAHALTDGDIALAINEIENPFGTGEERWGDPVIDKPVWDGLLADLKTEQEHRREELV